MSIFDMFDLGGKVSIVTGGCRDLGKIIATGLAEAGSNVVICSRKVEKCEETAQELGKLGVKALGIQCDITRAEDIDSVVNETLKNFQKIDILVNNSGKTWGSPPEELKIEDWNKVIDVNINGTFLFSQKVGREMIKQKRGKIINISSYTGLGGADPEYFDAIPYNTSKGAIMIFTQDLATKWAKYNINVNCLSPGWFPTKMTKWTLENFGEKITSRLLIKRFGEDDDIKGAVIYLSSRASDYITGQVLCVDGGITVWT
jgi:NAD(P)-dependent dehydrogenase (short-subunit alcohol dehydrogenase family)